MKRMNMRVCIILFWNFEAQSIIMSLHVTLLPCLSLSWNIFPRLLVGCMVVVSCHNYIVWLAGLREKEHVLLIMQQEFEMLQICKMLCRYIYYMSIFSLLLRKKYLIWLLWSDAHWRQCNMSSNMSWSVFSPCHIVIFFFRFFFHFFRVEYQIWKEEKGCMAIVVVAVTHSLQY